MKAVLQAVRHVFGGITGVVAARVLTVTIFLTACGTFPHFAFGVPAIRLTVDDFTIHRAVAWILVSVFVAVVIPARFACVVVLTASDEVWAGPADPVARTSQRTALTAVLNGEYGNGSQPLKPGEHPEEQYVSNTSSDIRAGHDSTSRRPAAAFNDIGDLFGWGETILDDRTQRNKSIARSRCPKRRPRGPGSSLAGIAADLRRRSAETSKQKTTKRTRAAQTDHHRDLFDRHFRAGDEKIEGLSFTPSVAPHVEAVACRVVKDTIGRMPMNPCLPSQVR